MILENDVLVICRVFVLRNNKGMCVDRSLTESRISDGKVFREVGDGVCLKCGNFGFHLTTFSFKVLLRTWISLVRLEGHINSLPSLKISVLDVF